MGTLELADEDEVTELVVVRVDPLGGGDLCVATITAAAAAITRMIMTATIPTVRDTPREELCTKILLDAVI